MLNFQKRVRKITPKILQLLTEWTETFPYDFRDERMMLSLKELTHRLASGEEVSVSLLDSFAASRSEVSSFGAKLGFLLMVKLWRQSSF